MEDGKIPEYLLASSAFPGFQSPEIAGKKYIDGGVYDNIPYTMARKRGYRRLIVIDISGIGIKRKLNVEGEPPSISKTPSIWEVSWTSAGTSGQILQAGIP
jgi:predicted acylesterase/phospholipase RssA